ncbi:MAG: DUF4434 domain-containing protein [Bacteroidota bacterium]|nr:DUF4434 domain-containing protein [Bacteroidota bacterium]
MKIKIHFKLYKVFVLCIILLSLVSCTHHKTTIKVNVDSFRVQRNDTVTIEVELSKTNKTVQAVLLKPAIGSSELLLEKVQGKPRVYKARIILDNETPNGLYAIHVWTGAKENPSAIGKATFLLGKMIVDFCYPSTFDKNNPDEEITNYLQDFRKTGGNFLIAHGLIGKTAHFPSKICESDLETGSPKDIVEAILRNGDEKGYPVLLSVSWDLTREIHSLDRMESIKSIMDELYSIYYQHPSLVGFYTYLEGSGTYFAPYMREFSDNVKKLNPGLLSGCSPYNDDPMLAGYLGIIESLDIIIYQGQVMASYRPDNRQKYPIRRVKDFCSLGIGAKQLQNKIALTHVELFGYLENKISPDHSTTSYENIYPQILSAATVTENDGISFFTYNSNIHCSIKKFPELKQSRKAVIDGMKAFDLICDKISNKPNNLTFYFPHSDWVIERWNNCFLPALDAFRTLGIAVDILPYVPRLSEDYPYWPNHANDSVMPRLLKDKKVIILPDISGFKRTDSDWIEMFVKEGGAVIAFGPQIPMARPDSYKRKDFFGLEESKPKNHTTLIVKNAIGKRVSEGKQYALPGVILPLWKTENTKVAATFEDGSPAIVINKYGKGTVATILVDATTAAEHTPGLIHDVIDFVMSTYDISLPVDILGLNKNVNIAVTKTENGFRVAVVNLNRQALEITLNARNVSENTKNEWYDLISEKNIENSKDNISLKLQVPGTDYICIEF